jgi:hypothetical protein
VIIADQMVLQWPRFSHWLPSPVPTCFAKLRQLDPDDNISQHGGYVTARSDKLRRVTQFVTLTTPHLVLDSSLGTRLSHVIQAESVFGILYFCVSLRSIVDAPLTLPARI